MNEILKYKLLKLEKWIKDNNPNIILFEDDLSISSAVVGKLLTNVIDKDKIMSYIALSDINSYNPQMSISKILDLRTFFFRLDVPVREYSSTIRSNNNDILYDKTELNRLGDRLKSPIANLLRVKYNAKIAGIYNKTDRYIGDVLRGYDDICDFNPISDLTYSEVTQLAKLLGVHNTIINSPIMRYRLLDIEYFGFTYKDIEEVMDGKYNNNRDKICQYHSKYYNEIKDTGL
jgi:NH3-dependent NAD+ synthetase